VTLCVRMGPNFDRFDQPRLEPLDWNRCRRNLKSYGCSGWHYLSIFIDIYPLTSGYFFPWLFYASNPGPMRAVCQTCANMTHVRSSGRAFLGSLAQWVDNTKEVDAFVSPRVDSLLRLSSLKSVCLRSLPCFVVKGPNLSLTSLRFFLLETRDTSSTASYSSPSTSLPDAANHQALKGRERCCASTTGIIGPRRSRQVLVLSRKPPL
jgi:hypothetical protein